jgi:protocatechuate 3,4-dioxygenase beta subunit
MYVAGEPGNDRDQLLRSISDPAARDRIIVALQPAPAIGRDALAGAFDIVLGAG